VSAKLKYGVCIGTGILVEIAGLLMALGATWMPCGHKPLPEVFGFVFPYFSIVVPTGEPGTLANTVAVLSLFQMPVYGWILARAWVRHRVWPEVTILGAIHFVSSMVGIMALARLSH
jgi:hypothetical protein